MAGVPARLAPIAVKLKGLTAYTKPSSGRYSMRFQTPFSDTGWWSKICSAKWAPKRKKSMISQAESISA